MTRVNIVPVEELCNEHMFAEWREMPRLVNNLKKSLNRTSKPFSEDEISDEYILGKGHVKFFFDKFEYLHKRHKCLTETLLERGYNLSHTDSSIFASVDSKWYNDYAPTEHEMNINRARINERLGRMKKITYGKK